MADRKTYPACGKCGYDVSGAERIGDPCPECGVPLAQAGVVPTFVGGRRTSSRRGPRVLVVLLLVGAAGFMGLAAIGFLRAQAARAQAVRQQAIAVQAQAQALQAVQVTQAIIQGGPPQAAPVEGDEAVLDEEVEPVEGESIDP